MLVKDVFGNKLSDKVSKVTSKIRFLRFHVVVTLKQQARITLQHRVPVTTIKHVIIKLFMLDVKVVKTHHSLAKEQQISLMNLSNNS